MRSMAFAGLLTLFATTAAHAVPLTFGCIQSQDRFGHSPAPANCATGLAQLGADMHSTGLNSVAFTFTNTGPNTSVAITDVYFDDGPFLGITSVTNGAGVSFAPWSTTNGVQPVELPGANLITPAFHTTKGFSADSNLPAVPNGVNSGEFVTINFSLLSGQTFSDALLALASGELRVGVYMRGFLPPSERPQCGEINPCGGNASFVNNPVRVPEASALLLVGSGFIATGIAIRRLRS